MRIRSYSAIQIRLAQARVRYHENLSEERERGRIKAWVYRARRIFGCEPERKYELLAAQDGVCAICKQNTPTANRGWQLDADHKQNPPFIRGVLCSECNLGLGKFSHNPKILADASSYIAMGCQ